MIPPLLPGGEYVPQMNLCSEKGHATWARDGGGQEGVGGGWEDRNPWLMMHSMAVGKGDAMRSWGVALGRRSSPLMRSMRMHT